MSTSLTHLITAREILSQHREALIGIDDERARHHADVLTAAMRECSDLIRDGRLAAVVHQQHEHAANTARRSAR